MQEVSEVLALCRVSVCTGLGTGTLLAVGTHKEGVKRLDHTPGRSDEALTNWVVR